MAEQSRRDFLFASGTIGAALVAGRVAGHAPRARTWLYRPDTTPSTADWNALRQRLSTHKLIRPGQAGYDFAKELYSPQFDYLHPSGIAYCARASDVAACVNFAARFRLPVRARSGGHSYGGWSSVNDGLIIDVTEINSMSFGTGTVKVGTGIDLINFYAGLAAKGKAVPGGSCPTVGIAGLTLGGGIGVVGRRFGLTSDNLKSLDIVIADGSTLTCNSGSHDDLYWASQGGGGGNFGVCTSFTFTTHDLRTIVVFFQSWPWSKAARVIDAWQRWAPSAPDALWSNMHVGAAFGGAPSIGTGGTYIGSVAGARAQLDKFYGLVGSGPSSSSLVEHSYLSAMLLEAGCASIPVHACDTPPGGSLPREPFYARSDFFSKPLSSAGIKAVTSNVERLRGIRGASGGGGSIAFDALGGAINRVSPTATAFVHRDSLFDIQYYTGWTWPGTASGRSNQYKWLTSTYADVHKYANGQAYQNYPDPTLADWRTAYYGVNYTRLSEVKAAYDPTQLFTFPQAITPPPPSGEPCMTDC
jgi:FAD/FMN-containing dehydrogenase